MSRLFSIITVCLDPGEKLSATLKSIAEQEFDDYEIIVKDGGSTDGSLDVLSSYDDKDIKLINGTDKGIYDAMNTALKSATGRYVYFLNCGDAFSDSKVLGDVADRIREYEKEAPEALAVFYGNVVEKTTDTCVMSNPVIDAFACYRNVPCHQACFYNRDLVNGHPFNDEYKVRADYEQFLWCFFKAGAKMIYLNRVIADYEGNGYSESKEGKRLSDKEHKTIVSDYMTKGQVLKYRLIMILSLSGLRGALSKSRVFAGPYNALKRKIYSGKVER